MLCTRCYCVEMTQCNTALSVPSDELVRCISPAGQPDFLLQFTLGELMSELNQAVIHGGSPFDYVLIEGLFGRLLNKQILTDRHYWPAVIKCMIESIVRSDEASDQQENLASVLAIQLWTRHQFLTAVQFSVYIDAHLADWQQTETITLAINIILSQFEDGADLEELQRYNGRIVQYLANVFANGNRKDTQVAEIYALVALNKYIDNTENVKSYLSHKKFFITQIKEMAKTIPEHLRPLEEAKNIRLVFLARVTQAKLEQPHLMIATMTATPTNTPSLSYQTWLCGVRAHWTTYQAVLSVGTAHEHQRVRTVIYKVRLFTLGPVRIGFCRRGAHFQGPQHGFLDRDQHHLQGAVVYDVHTKSLWANGMVISIGGDSNLHRGSSAMSIGTVVMAQVEVNKNWSSCLVKFVLNGCDLCPRHKLLLNIPLSECYFTASLGLMQMADNIYTPVFGPRGSAAI